MCQKCAEFRKQSLVGQRLSTDGPSVGSYLADAWILIVFNQQRANYVPDSRLVHFGGQHLILAGSEMIKDVVVLVWWYPSPMKVLGGKWSKGDIKIGRAHV